ncbi:hypothetical protein NEOKW01_1425 [Nematocida sp. AWRm80]|nr:hypothetical protein NEOKW01_1425 [Nematocida sp. AWRm80]
MHPYIDIFVLYIVYVIVFSFFNSSEDIVIMGKQSLDTIQRLEVLIVNRMGCIIPYFLLYVQLIIIDDMTILSIISIITEVIVYVIVKDTIITYVKELRIYRSPELKLPLNPSGHTFMFLNGIFLMIPITFYNYNNHMYILFICSVLTVYEYNRLLIETIRYYHTFSDICMGVIFFCLFRAVVYPVRRVYSKYQYKNEFKVQEYFFLSVIISILLLVT